MLFRQLTAKVDPGESQYSSAILPSISRPRRGYRKKRWEDKLQRE